MAKVNEKWASGVGADGKPVYAPADAITVNGRLVIAPKDAHYRAAHYKAVVDTRPSEPPPEGFYWASRGWYEEGGEVRRAYGLEPLPPKAPTKYSKLKLYAALVQAGLWDAFAAWLAEQTVEGINGYTAFSLAQDLTDNHPLFAPLFASAKSTLGITDEQGEAILAASIMEG